MNLLRLSLLPLLAAATLLAGCGGGHYHDEVIVETVIIPVGDVEVDNQTDLSGSFEDLYGFYMTPAGTNLWTENLLPYDVLPGEIVFLGQFDEDVYDAEAEATLGIVSFFDVFVQGGFTTTFEVY